MLGDVVAGSDRVLRSAPAAEPPVHVVVFKQPGHFGGWPANHGMWAWGNEIVVGHRDGKFKIVKRGHAIDGSRRNTIGRLAVSTAA